LNGFDESKPKHKQENGVATVIYSDLSTCDTIVLPGFANETSRQSVLDIMASKGMTGLEVYTSKSKPTTTLLSKIDINNTRDFAADIKYPVENSKCKGDTSSGSVDFSGSFYGEVTFHDPVNKTVVMAVNFPSEEGQCRKREALATEICKTVASYPSDYDFFVSGTFGVPTSGEVYQEVLEGCGFKKGSSITKKSVSNAKGTLVEDVYIRGGATKWLDIFSSIPVIDPVFEGQSLITYPTILYVHQPLSKHWFKFEVSFTAIMMTASIGFFTWLMFFSRERKEDEAGEYEKIPGN
jgi:hypothetical protein